jgi:twitching motility protein PilT
MAAMTLEQLLSQIQRVGAKKLQLVPGRRMLIDTPQGDREITGAEQTSEGIFDLLAPILPSNLTEGIPESGVEWQFELPEIGTVNAHAWRGHEGTSATLTLASTAAGVRATIATTVNKAGIAAMEELFRGLFKTKASDLHMCVGSPPVLRHDGAIKPITNRSPFTPAELEKMLLSIAPERNREEFARRHDTDFAYEIPGVARFRCNLFMDRKGIGGVFRVIPNQILTAEEMGLSPEILGLCNLSKGLVLVTGPTGSGKSTTLCAMIDYMNRKRSDHIITIEDPLEFVHENKKCLINQRQVGEHTNSFKDALRAALREDPDIVLVGEMRDLETIAIAIETAETGHLVFGTLHTSSAASTVDRIIDQFPADRQSQIRQMLAESLKGVISQMLCKKIGGGRVPALEVLIGVPAISNLIREAKVFQIPSIMQTGRKLGMCLMNDALYDLVKRGIVEPKEAYMKAIDKSNLLIAFRKANIDTSYVPSAEAAAVTPAQ